MTHKTIEIANEFLCLAAEAGRDLTPMQLQKLVYLAHGWSLAIFDRPLAAETVEAWDYGPVYKSLYRSLKKYGAREVTTPINYGDDGEYNTKLGTPASAEFTPQHVALIKKIWQTYGRYEAFQLSALTHKDDTPWTQIYRSAGKSSPIPDELIRRYFLNLATDQSGGARASNS